MSTTMFGTDGVRGTPGQPPLDDETIARLGAATVRVLGGDAVTLLVARDTRASGPQIEQQLARGVCSAGGRLVSVGVMPTPAAAFLAQRPEFSAALVISASHNPFPDNGIKVLTGEGEKASPALEREIETLVADPAFALMAPTTAVVESRDLSAAYMAHLQRVLDGIDLPPLRVAVDCANGATTQVGPAVLRALGIDVVPLGIAPDGRNINDGCGSTHPEAVQQVVVEQECQLGMAFDGDGDRVILVDDRGEVVDGDAMLLICARSLKSRGRLTGDAIVATVMSNLGLEVALRQAGITMHRCPVGDRDVREAMRARGAVLGGEQSGHIIFAERLPTGDGLQTALSVLRVVVESGRPLAALRQDLEVFPQVLLNVPVREKPAIESQPAIVGAIAAAEAALADDGRVLVRYSGTEPLLRVMIEGRDAAVVQHLAEQIAEQATQQLG